MALAPIFAGQRGTAALIASIAPLSAVKQADQQVSNNTLVNDNQIVIPNLIVNAQYVFVCYLDYEGGANGASDLQINWVIPSGATIRMSIPTFLTTGNTIDGAKTFTASPSAAFGTSGATLRSLLMIGSLFMANNPGSIQLQWAQNTTNGTPTIVHAQSFLAMWRTS